MTDRHGERDNARAVLQRLPIPEHRKTFWDELDRRLDALPAALIDLPRSRSQRLRKSPRWLGTVAAVVVIVGLTAAAIAVLTHDDREGVQVLTPATTAAPTTAAPTTEPTATSVVGVDPGAAGAQAAVLEWIDLLAAGDMAAAWERLGPAAQAGWGSYEAFEEARTAFAEGFGTWANAEGREVGVATVTRTDQGALHVVTVTGVRHPEGNREDAALALVVREDAGANHLVESPSPSNAGPVMFRVPAVSPAPPTIGADEAVVVATSGPVTILSLVIDRDGEVVPLTPVLDADGTASHLPPGGWSPGRHVVTAVMDGVAGPVATAVAFDVG